MPKHNRMRRKENKLKVKALNKETDGVCHNENTSDRGAHYERTKNREQQKLMEKYFGNER